jgi:hypothetical protein
VGDAEGVFDCPVDLVGLGELEVVFDCAEELVGVFVAPIVRVLVVDPVCVFVPALLRVDRGEDDAVLEVLDVFVEVIEDVMVLLVVEEGLTKKVGRADRVRVVVLVDVFESVDVDVCIATPFNKTRVSLGYVLPIAPNKNSRSHRIL